MIRNILNACYTSDEFISLMCTSQNSENGQKVRFLSAVIHTMFNSNEFIYVKFNDFLFRITLRITIAIFHQPSFHLWHINFKKCVFFDNKISREH